MRKWTEELVREWLRNNCSNIGLVKWGGGSGKSSVWKCLVDGCGFIWHNSFNNIKDKGQSRCKKCDGWFFATEANVKLWLLNNASNINLIFWGGSSTAQSRFVCNKCGYEWFSTFSYVKSGRGCCRCFIKRNACLRSMKIGEAQKWLIDNNRKIEIVQWGGGSSKKSKFRCKDKGCKHEWETTFSSIKRGSGCPECAKKRIGKSRTMNAQQCILWLREYRPEIELVEWGGGSIVRSRFRCNKCGWEWEVAFSDLKLGRGCPCCADHICLSELDVRGWLKKTRSQIALVYYGGKTNAVSRFSCSICGREWETTFSSIKRGSGCPECASLARRLSAKDVERYLKKYRPTLELVEYGGKAEETVSRFRCKLCGHEYSALFSSIRGNRGSGCPGCASLVRRFTEEEVRIYLKQRSIILVSYAGKSCAPSTFLCENCGNSWVTTFDSIRQDHGCPACNANGKHYLYQGIHFHSSLEIAFYMYWEFCKHQKLYRNPQIGGSGYWIPYGRGRREFHPDFITANHRLIEIKPENGGKDREHRAKRRASKKCGRKVYWYGYREINPMKKWLLAHGYDWEQYRVNGKKDKPKVKKQDKTDECEGSCCGKA